MLAEVMPLAGTTDPENQRIFRQLTAKSLRDPMDYHLSVPWEKGVDKTKPAKRFEQTWLYNSSAWRKLTPEQQLEVTWLETARDVSMFINLEHLIPELYTGYLNQYAEAINTEAYEYLMVFSREELMHILAFNKYLRVAGMARHAKMQYFYDLSDYLKTTRPELGIAFTLLIEWLAENKAMLSSQTDEIDEVTRSMWRAHHLDEVRHIHFGKQITEAYFAMTPLEDTARTRQQLKEMVLNIVHAVPQIMPYASFTFPFDMNDPNLIAEVRASEHYKSVIEARYGEIFRWCRKLGIDV